MKNVAFAEKKILNLEALKHLVASWKVKSKTVAFTNGCFDIFHSGHMLSINNAAKTADYLIVAINSDASVKKLKGSERPINKQEDRALLLANLLVVDAVVIFDEDTPLETIKKLLPDVLVKGGDYSIDQIVGAKEVVENGGQVIINPILDSYSTTNLIQKIKA